MLFRILICFSFLSMSSVVVAKNNLEYSVNYQISVDLKRQGLNVKLVIDKGELINSLRFSNANEKFKNIKATGKLVESGESVQWFPGKSKSVLSYFVAISSPKGAGQFDAYATSSWLLLRGDDMIPAFFSDFIDGAESRATMSFDLPEGWSSETAWPKKNGSYWIDNPERKFDRPYGWILLGDVGSRRAKVSGTSLVVASPKNSGMQRMEALTFFSFVWPEVKKTFGTVPEKLLIVGAPDPMWRGGLSAPNSLYLHVDRPLVSENGTSPLFHELFHLLTRIRGFTSGKINDDWIAEGLAEYYSFELLYKSGGISKSRKKKILTKLAEWGKDVRHLRASKSTGPNTARAVVLLAELDEEIQQASQKKYDLSDVTRTLMKKREVSLDDLQSAVQSLIGPSKTLQSPLLK
jgi:hypothetical protein